MRIAILRVTLYKFSLADRFFPLAFRYSTGRDSALIVVFLSDRIHRFAVLHVDATIFKWIVLIENGCVSVWLHIAMRPAGMATSDTFYLQ
jgi:hypothetical protein